MNARAVIGHLILAIAGLGLALGFYLRSKQGTSAADSVVLLDLHKRDIQKLAWSEPGKSVVVEKRQEKDGEPFYWIKSESERDGGTDTKEVRATAEVDKLIDSFAPLRATRTLGVVPAEKLKEFGIADSKKSLAIATPSQEDKLVIGDAEYGSDQRYVENPRDSAVYMVKGFTLTNVENAASRYMERQLHHFSKSDIEKVTLTAGSKTAEVVQKNRIEPGKAFWVRPSSPDKRDDTIGNWMDKVLAMNAIEYAPTPPAATEVVKFVFHGKDSELGTMSLWKVPSADGKRSDYYVQSDYNVASVKVPTGEEVAKEVDKIVAE